LHIGEEKKEEKKNINKDSNKKDSKQKIKHLLYLDIILIGLDSIFISSRK